jgi:hypothetical protein
MQLGSRSRVRPRCCALTAALTVALVAGDVRSEPRCPSIAGGTTRLEAQDAEARLAFIRSRLRYDARKARQWSWGFGATFGVLTVAAVAAVPLAPDKGTRADIIVGGAGALIGVGFLALAPLTVMRDHDVLEAHLASAGPSIDICRRLALAESLFVRDAMNEADGRGWLSHVLNAAIGVAALLTLGLGYGRWRSGVQNAVGTIAVGELMIGIQPHRLVRDLRYYRAGDLRPPPRRRRGRR